MYDTAQYVRQEVPFTLSLDNVRICELVRCCTVASGAWPWLGMSLADKFKTLYYYMSPGQHMFGLDFAVISMKAAT